MVILVCMVIIITYSFLSYFKIKELEKRIEDIEIKYLGEILKRELLEGNSKNE